MASAITAATFISASYDNNYHKHARSMKLGIDGFSEVFLLKDKATETNELSKNSNYAYQAKNYDLANQTDATN